MRKRLSAAVALVVVAGFVAYPAASSAAVSAIGFESEGGTWAIPASGGSPSRLTADGGLSDFSPDGSRFAVFGSAGIDVANIDGSNRTTVRPVQGVWFHGGPDFGPNGQVFFAEAGVPQDAGTQSDVSDAIRVVNADGTGLRTVFTAPPRYFLGAPAVSPDGRRVVFQMRNKLYDSADEGLWSVGVDGGSAMQLTADGWDDDPAFDPSGNLIAFTSGGDVALMRSDGTGATRLTDSPDTEEDPTFSPDGGMIAFEHEIEDNIEDHLESQIEVMNLNGSGRTAITTGIDGEESGPTWAILDSLPAPPDVGDEEGFARQVSISYSARKKSFSGRVRSDAAECVQGRVTVRRVTKGPDRKVAVGMADERGKWNALHQASSGKYYAAMKPATVAAGVCEAATSKKITLDFA